MANFLHLRNLILKPTKINKIIVYLTISDLLTWGPHLVVISITGIFLSQRIDENVVQIVGIGMGIYMATRGILQLPIGRILDHFHYDNDEIIMLAIGNVLMGITYIFYPLIETADLYYALQFVFAIGAAMNLVAWKKLFAQNLDKHSEGMEYGEYGFVMGISAGIFGIVSGSVANLSMFYFNLVIVSLGILTMIASLFALLIFTVKKRKSSLW